MTYTSKLNSITANLGLSAAGTAIILYLLYYIDIIVGIIVLIVVREAKKRLLPMLERWLNE